MFDYLFGRFSECLSVCLSACLSAYRNRHHHHHHHHYHHHRHYQGAGGVEGNDINALMGKEVCTNLSHSFISEQ
jgi:hypothetical protein